MPKDTILVHLKARADVIERRMEEDRHTYHIVPREDVREILDEFQSEYAACWIMRKFEIDTSDMRPHDLLQAFLDGSVPYLNDRDTLTRMNT